MLMRHPVLALLLFVCIQNALMAQPTPTAPPAPTDTPAQVDKVRESVVKILSTVRRPNVFRPWAKENPADISGSGSVIDGHRILTNAHVVAFASQIYVQPNHSAQKIAAKVEFVAPGMDLAILKLDDESFFDTHEPLKLAAALPAMRANVTVYGYPMGGTEMSVTQGIVSRIEYGTYYHSVGGLRMQIDAALNPGNSGGPAIVDGVITGVVFSRMQEAENIGYLIPAEEVKRFLDDVADGQYDGKPTLSTMLFQDVENEALRARLKLPEGTGGVMVEKLFDPDASLLSGDVITKIGDHPIDSEGSVAVGSDLRLRFDYLVPILAKDGKLDVTVLRDGKPMPMQLPVETHRPRLIPANDDHYPRYFVYGPLVFSPADTLTLQSAGRLIGYLAVSASPLVTRTLDQPGEVQELVIIASPFLPHKLVKGYSDHTMQVVSSVNGVEVKSLHQLAQLLRDAKDEYITFEFAGNHGEMLVFRRAEIEAASEDILNDNGIRQPYSDDLRDVFEKKTP
ncbi:MAG: trypsin-like serine protease [Planctomycetes bacterium]|nr:trypsin-like serine protease [Planctomycetota bacterium]